MKDLLKVFALLALLIIAGFQTCSNSKSAASPDRKLAGINVQNDTYSTAQNQPIVLDVLANDTFNPEKSTVVFSNPKHGSISHNTDGSGFRYIPAKNFKGYDAFEYRVCVGDACQSALVKLNVL